MASFASSYIPTTSGSVTRAADALNIVGTADLPFVGWNPVAGTMLEEHQSLSVLDVNSNIVSALNSVTAHGFVIANGGSAIEFYVYDGSNEFSTTSAFSAAAIKLALAWAADDAVAYSAGTLVGSDAAVNLPTGINKLHFTAAPGWYGAPFLHLKSCSYFPSRISNAELQRLTS